MYYLYIYSPSLYRCKIIHAYTFTELKLDNEFTYGNSSWSVCGYKNFQTHTPILEFAKLCCGRQSLF